MREPSTTRTLRSWWGWSLAAVVAAVAASLSPQAPSPVDPTLAPDLWMAAGDWVMEQSPEGAMRQPWEAPSFVQAPTLSLLTGPAFAGSTITCADSTIPGTFIEWVDGDNLAGEPRSSDASNLGRWSFPPSPAQRPGAFSMSPTSFLLTFSAEIPRP